VNPAPVMLTIGADTGMISVTARITHLTVHEARQ
jgi:hypothetical protein